LHSPRVPRQINLCLEQSYENAKWFLEKEGKHYANIMHYENINSGESLDIFSREIVTSSFLIALGNFNGFSHLTVWALQIFAVSLAILTQFQRVVHTCRDTAAEQIIDRINYSVSIIWQSKFRAEQHSRRILRSVIKVNFVTLAWFATIYESFIAYFIYCMLFSHG